MSISIILCTRNRPDHLGRCLAQLTSIQLAPVGEIIVLDQSDQAMQPDHLPALTHPLVHYHWRRGRGLASARNQAIRLAQGNILAFTDDDCFVSADWACQIERSFASNPHTSGLFGRVLAYATTADHLVYHTWPTDFGLVYYATRADQATCMALIDQPAAAAFDYPVMPVENLGAGNNMAFRRSVFTRHGLFIESLGAGQPVGAGEDIEFHWRLLRAGCVLLYNPALLVYHNGWLSPTQRAVLQDNYNRSMIAVCTAFALQGERLAWQYLRFRLKSLWRGLRAVSPLPSSAQKAQPPSSAQKAQSPLQRAYALAQGLPIGVHLALAYRRLIPSL